MGPQSDSVSTRACTSGTMIRIPGESVSASLGTSEYQRVSACAPAGRVAEPVGLVCVCALV